MMTKKDFLTNAGEEFYKEKAHVFELLFEDEAEWPGVLLLDQEKKNANTGNRVRGQYFARERKVVIYIRSCDTPEVAIQTLYHECRHHWQWLRYPGIFQWWLNHGELYRETYATLLNPLEEDARVFSRTLDSRFIEWAPWLFEPKTYSEKEVPFWLGLGAKALIATRKTKDYPVCFRMVQKRRLYEAYGRFCC